MTTRKLKVAIIGSGNIGTDLMIKVMRNSQHLEMGAMVGVDPESDGLARANRLGIATTHEGIEGLLRLPVFKDIDIAFDATSAGAHKKHDEILRMHGVQVIDLTPAAIGPYVIPSINLEDVDAPNINMVTCGGQATIPMVAAVSKVARVYYGEIVASISSKANSSWSSGSRSDFRLGPGWRAGRLRLRPALPGTRTGGGSRPSRQWSRAAQHLRPRPGHGHTGSAHTVRGLLR